MIRKKERVDGEYAMMGLFFCSLFRRAAELLRTKRVILKEEGFNDDSATMGLFFRRNITDEEDYSEE